ncbi:MAG TPA: copper ion binding protein [Oscillospiraceae bacterium]|nr:copper ion binding protein [Oscillospiraceae bacterium]
MAKTLFKIEGMSCEHCVRAVKNAVEDLEGAVFAKVELKSKTAEVEYDENVLDKAQIIQAIKEEGYEVLED